jgi:hypothetical protein
MALNTGAPTSYYVYQPLAHELEIRILVLHPADDHQAAIQCSIEHQARPDPNAESFQLLDYVALSYVWW